MNDLRDIGFLLATGLGVLTVVGVVACFNLIDIAASLKKKEPSAPAPQLAAVESIPLQAYKRQDLCEVIRREGCGWVHHSWVREGSAAHEWAYNTPDFAIVRGDRTEEGVQ